MAYVRSNFNRVIGPTTEFIILVTWHIKLVTVSAQTQHAKSQKLTDNDTDKNVKEFLVSDFVFLGLCGEPNSQRELPD